jgi:hypothetical protein
MVEIIAPLSIEIETAVFFRSDETSIVEIAFGDQVNAPAALVGITVHDVRKLFEERVGGAVEDGVYRIEPKCVYAAVADPEESILDEVPPHMITERAIEVDGLAPRRTIPIRKIGSEIAEVVAFRAEVVVDHIQYHSKAARMTRVDETPECCVAPVTAVGGERVHPVVAPVSLAREFSDWHQFDCSNPELLESV